MQLAKVHIIFEPTLKPWFYFAILQNHGSIFTRYLNHGFVFLPDLWTMVLFFTRLWNHGSIFYQTVKPWFYFFPDFETMVLFFNQTLKSWFYFLPDFETMALFFLPDCETMILILPWLKAWFFFQPLWNLWFHFHQSFLTVLDPFEHHFFQFSASSFCSIFLHITHKTIFIDILKIIIITNNITPRCVTLFVIQVSESCFAYFCTLFISQGACLV